MNKLSRPETNKTHPAWEKKKSGRKRGRVLLKFGFIHNQNSGGALDSLLGHFVVFLGPLWGIFGVTFVGLWGTLCSHLWLTLGSLWYHIGVTLGESLHGLEWHQLAT